MQLVMPLEDDFSSPVTSSMNPLGASPLSIWSSSFQAYKLPSRALVLSSELGWSMSITGSVRCHCHNPWCGNFHSIFTAIRVILVPAFGLVDLSKLISKTTLLSVESVQLITENHRKVPSDTELYRKWTKKLAYKPYLKISLNLLCIQNKPFAYWVWV